MRVAIDATALGSNRGGDETYMRGLLVGLAEVWDGTDRFIAYLRPGARPAEALREHPAFVWRQLPWGPPVLRFTLRLPHALASEAPRPDLLHSVTHAPPLSLVPRALMITDLSFRRRPDLYPRRTRLRLDLLVPIHARQSRVVMTLSEFCRRDLVSAFGIDPARVFVVPCALETRAPRSDAAVRGPRLARLGISWPYFLYVGNLHPRKNVARLIAAFARARRASARIAAHRLVIVGGRWWSGTDEERAARELPEDSVVFLGRVDDDDRDHLLAGATLLAYPSLFEGFGLPPLEAMASGTPVLASNAAALPETLGDAALLVDPMNVDALADGLTRLAIEPGLRETLRERGLRRVRVYTPRATGERAVAAFRHAIYGIARDATTTRIARA